MNGRSCVSVRAWWACCATAAVAVVAGCTPRNIGWMPSDPEVGPRPAAAAAAATPRGYLSIVTQHFGEPGDAEPEEYPPVFLYDRSGKWLAELPNLTDRPMGLAPGEYIVLIGESLDPMGEFRQVQVRIVANETTRVNQSDIAAAPELWALSRALSR